MDLTCLFGISAIEKPSTTSTLAHKARQARTGPNYGPKTIGADKTFKAHKHAIHERQAEHVRITEHVQITAQMQEGVTRVKGDDEGPKYVKDKDFNLELDGQMAARRFQAIRGRDAHDEGQSDGESASEHNADDHNEDDHGEEDHSEDDHSEDDEGEDNQSAEAAIDQRNDEAVKGLVEGTKSLNTG